MTDLTLSDLADQVLMANYNGTKRDWGQELLDLVRAHDEQHLMTAVHEKTVTALGNVVNSRKTSRETAAKNERLASRAVAYTGRPLNPTISVRTESGARQGVLWIYATPRQYIDAVIREQKVIDGRNDANAVRLQLVELMQQDDHLQDLATLKDVCDELGIDPDTLGLDDLDAA